jgi:hypothetical protein
MKRIHCDEFQNDAGETVDGPSFKAESFGSDADEAFVRGRDYATKRRPASAIKAACKNKPAAICAAMMDGWKWQKRRMK